MEIIHKEIYKAESSKHALIAAVQVRILGAKGMLTRDDGLEENKVVLRKSMVKFKDKRQVEKTQHIYILGWSSPKNAFADRQIIILLLNLGLNRDVLWAK